MVSSEKLLSYPYWKVTFTVHTDASDKQLGDDISHNNKPIAFSYIRLRNPQIGRLLASGLKVNAP